MRLKPSEFRSGRYNFVVKGQNQNITKVSVIERGNVCLYNFNIKLLINLSII